MRSALAILDGQRLTVTAVVLRHGRRIGWTGRREPTILLGRLTTLDGALLADHLWFPAGRRFAALDLHAGDSLQLVARVGTYRRVPRRLDAETAPVTLDYCMKYPSQIRVLARAEQPEPTAAPVVVAPVAPAPLAPLPAPGAAAALAGDLLTNRERILATLAALCTEREEPPSLTRLLAQLPMSPIGVVQILRRAARAGIVCFSPDGAITLLSAERSA